MSWFTDAAATIAEHLGEAIVEVAKGRRVQLHFPGETPASEAMDPGLAENYRGHVNQDKPVGAGGTPAYGGFVMEIERNPDMRGPRRFITYNNNVRNCDAVAVGTRALLMLIGGVHWDVDPPQTETAAADPSADQAKVDGEDTKPGFGAPRPPGPRRPKQLPAGTPPNGAPTTDKPRPAKKLAAPGEPRDPDEEQDLVEEPGEGEQGGPNDPNGSMMAGQAEVDPVAEEAKAKAEWLEKVLFEDMATPWTTIVRRLGMYKFHGFTVHEWTAKRRDDGTIGIDDIENRPQGTIEKWDMDRSGTVQGCVQRVPLDGSDAYIPRWKMVYVVDDELADGDPTGVGLFRHCAEKVRQVQRLEALEGQGYETDLRGIPVTKVPLAELKADKSLDDTKIAALLKPYTDFMTGHVRNTKLAMMVDSTPYRSLDANGTPSATPKWGVELLTGGGQSHEAVRVAIDGKHREIARVMFAEGFMLGGDGGSNRALGEEKNRFFADFANSVLTDICNALNRDIVHQLWALNGYDVALRPTLRFEAVSIQDVARVAEMLEKMAKAGAKLHPKDPVINTVRVRARLPKVSDEIMNEMDQQAKDMAMAEVEATRMGTAATEAGIGQAERKLDMDAENAEADRELAATNADADRKATMAQAQMKKPAAPTKRPRK